jgi:hypothetical protein
MSLGAPAESGAGAGKGCRRALGGMVLLAGLAACGDAESGFIAGRLQDQCNENWPVCASEAGCVIGNGQYVPGTFPGTLRMITTIQLPTTVTIELFLKTEGAVGSVTHFVWNETGCGSAFVDTVNGKDVFAAFDTAGEFKDSHDLFEAGDHLIQVDSDATANYLLKLDLSLTTSGP